MLNVYISFQKKIEVCRCLLCIFDTQSDISINARKISITLVEVCIHLRSMCSLKGHLISELDISDNTAGLASQLRPEGKKKRNLLNRDVPGTETFFYTLVDKKEKQYIYIYIFARRHLERDCAKQTQ